MTRFLFFHESVILAFTVCTLWTVVEAGDACCKAAVGTDFLIADPFAKKPILWDDEDDGVWDSPKVLLSSLPTWYQLIYETRLGLVGAAPWLIVGVVAAALLTTFLKPMFPSSILRFWLGSNKNTSSKSNTVIDSLRGSLFGLLVPFCSCGALPLALVLKQEGVSSASIAAFVTAAQAAGVDSLFYTYGIFGFRVAFLRIAAAGTLAFVVGITLGVNDINKEESLYSREKPKGQKISNEESCCVNDDNSEKDGCHKMPLDNATKPASTTSTVTAIKLFVNTAVGLFSQVALWVLAGCVVSAFLSVLAPPTSTASFAPASSINISSVNDAMSLIKSLASRMSLFALTLPMTICEHGIVPLADALKGLGFSAGTTVALVVIGPSTNISSLLILSRLNSNDWIFECTKITAVILIFGISLSYLSEEIGSSVMIAKAEADTAGGGVSSSGLPEWLNQNAVSLTGMFTIASILQSSLWLFQSSSPSSCSG
mmetsp:Transcript_53692/g.60022  ORF Transcript_53692/g.60022 Transcript_53692/m.60022 type:complete len:485 (-) Transcript_53692:1207-2661(-)